MLDLPPTRGVEETYYRSKRDQRSKRDLLSRSNRDKHARGAAGGGDGPGDASGYFGVGKR